MVTCCDAHGWWVGGEQLGQRRGDRKKLVKAREETLARYWMSNRGGEGVWGQAER